MLSLLVNDILFKQIISGGIFGILLLLSFILLKQFLNQRQQKKFQQLWLLTQETLVTKEDLEQRLKEQVSLSISDFEKRLLDKLNHLRIEQIQQEAQLKGQLQQAFTDHRLRFDERQLETMKILHDTLHKGVQDNRQQLRESLADHAKEFGTRFESLTKATETKLKDINEQVELRLASGFEKTNETFNEVIKRLSLIDAAQQKISELSSNVISLQEILADKRSRGAFGEIQLSALINNMIPAQHYSFQHQLSNHCRVDCLLFLPEPTGNIAIDAKFPLENFRLMMENTLSDSDQLAIERQFKQDIKKHIQDIATKYIIPGETSDGAIMFIPAEAIFAEIHAHHYDLVEFAQLARVWLVSPTTLMAILTTARAVLKDAATRKHITEIQKHLRLLSDDFYRFQLRMDNLAKHISQANSDVEQVHISSRKISQRFMQIDRAELADLVSTEPELVTNVVADEPRDLAEAL